MDAVVKRCFTVIFVGAFGFSQTAEAMPRSDTTPPSGVSAADFAVPRDRVHLSAQALQAIYLNGLRLGAQKAAGSAKVTSCLLSVWYTDTGTVQVVQVIKSSGMPMVDQACLQGSIGQRLEGMLPGKSGGRGHFAIYWVFDAKESNAAQRPPIKLDPSIPQLPADGGIHPLPTYPADALARRAHGICKMHISVSAGGVVSSIEITQSTGSESLDDACKEAVAKSAFVPATDGEKPVSGTTDAAILWRLPRS
ncbi:MAG TPA: energy transducer TonB [Steroidobacteraceae bacterium]|nr:energy transducer TonB [Steroidobacteraceae bacterium]